MSESGTSSAVDGIAIIGMSGRFPGANNIDKFWDNLKGGVESIAFFSDAELEATGIEPEVLRAPNYVKAGATLEHIDLFDAAFFGMSPREAATTDPQHRIFLECAWEALESAGYDPATYRGMIGVYAGAGVNTYALHSINAISSDIQTLISSDKDFLTTRVSYKLDLKGPSVVVQTACSTSLVAVQLACQSLQNYQCDIALAGGVSIFFTQKTGYVYRPEGILSPDGHCRAFDARAQGTVAGDGVGLVVLKRLEDALADRDFIYAVIKGAAINNDGAVKVGYTAPSVEGQAEVIAMAQAVAGVDPATITYVEAHGTGTALGDPIEIAALTEVFRARTHKQGFCAIGSLKTNVGHLNAAAGVAGLMKTVLMLTHKTLLPSLHFSQPNPKIDFANSPFYVNTTLAAWPAGEAPRRAGVSSFGIGGTNAHVILEEAGPAVHQRAAQVPSTRPWQLLLLSARTSTALEVATANLVQHLQQQPGRASEAQLNLADVAYTLQVGRRTFEHRRMAVCQSLDEASTVLQQLDPQRVFSAAQKPRGNAPGEVVFLFPGQGAQYVHMASELYQTEPTFRDQVDHCAELLRLHLGMDLRHLLYPDAQPSPAHFPPAALDGAPSLQQTALAQPVLFVIEYALAQLWMAWGVQPRAMIGHSIGEYTAACLAGVFSLEDGLRLVTARGRLMQQLPGGAMLAVPLSEPEVRRLMPDQLSLAAINAPSRCVVSGATAAVEAWHKQLAARGLPCRRLHTSHAFHSAMVEPILGAFKEQVENVTLHPPHLPYVSNVTGAWVSAAEATDAGYWVRHLRHTVRFAAGMEVLLQEPGGILLEVGPGRTLSTLVHQHPTRDAERVVLTSLPHAQQRQSDSAFVLHTLGKLWLAGVRIDWAGFYAHEQRHRLPLPTSPFERQRYWIDAQQRTPDVGVGTAHNAAPWRKKPDVADWFYIPSWKRSIASALQPHETSAASPTVSTCWLLLLNEHPLGLQLVKRLEQEGQEVITVQVGAAFTPLRPRAYALNPRCRADYDALLAALGALDQHPATIVHLWNLTPHGDRESGAHDEVISPQRLDQVQEVGFYSLLFLAQALGKEHVTGARQIAVVSNAMQEVTGAERVCPEKATVLGPVRVIPQEYPNIRCRSIDLEAPAADTGSDGKLVDQLLAELRTTSAEQVIAYRGKHRWVQTFEPVRLDGTLEGRPRLFSFEPLLADGTLAGAPRLRVGGVYLITGGLGGIGLTLAQHLAKTVRAKLVLTGRTALPARETWQDWLAVHDEHDGVSRTIRQVQACEAWGAEVVAVSADVANPQQMHGVITQSLARFGRIHGVIHAAGVPGGGVMQRKTPEDAARVLAPKVQGTLVLEAALKDVQLDFFVLCSSLASIQGMFGQVDYAAANAFLDAFAHHRTSRDEGVTVCINWDTWQEVGMAVNTPVPPELEEWRQEHLRHGMLPNEGVDAFNCILGSRLPQVLVSTHDLPTRLEQVKALSVLQVSEKAHVAKPTHPRPALSNAFVAPRHEMEHRLADIWQELLGVEQVGVHDNFFALGGDSLLAILLNARLAEAYHVQIAVQDLFDGPTIAHMAERLQEADQREVAAIEKKLEMVEQLSADEVKRLLAELQQ